MDNDIIQTILYTEENDQNKDSFEIWRNSDDIGYVQLAFRIIVEAIYDLILGTPDEILSASWFFFGEMISSPIEPDTDCRKRTEELCYRFIKDRNICIFPLPRYSDIVEYVHLNHTSPVGELSEWHEYILNKEYDYDLDETRSLYGFYAEVLGYNRETLPLLVKKSRKGLVKRDDVENLRNLYTVMANAK